MSLFDHGVLANRNHIFSVGVYIKLPMSTLHSIQSRSPLDFRKGLALWLIFLRQLLCVYFSNRHAEAFHGMSISEKKNKIHRSSLKKYRTNSLLNDLVRVIFMRGVLVTIAQTLLVISFYALPTKLTWQALIKLVVAGINALYSCRMAFHINVAKLYVNTFCE